MSEKMAKTAVELVLLRNFFYRDGYARVLLAVFLALAVNALLVMGIFYKYTHPPEPQYFPTTADGRLILIHPLSDPVLTDQEVLQWVSVAVRRMFEIDFVHWQDQLQQISNYFTPGGWNYFIAALKSSDNLNTVRDLKMVASAQITGAPQITEKAVVSGRYAWKIQVPLLVTYQSAARNSITQTMNVTLVVLRVPVQTDPDRIAINNFIPTLST